MRYLLTFSYDGSLFYGYQKQKNKRTIQEEIEKILSIIFNEKVIISASGRTDAKVHAFNQKAHFDQKEMDLNKLKSALNKMLPKDIYIKDIQKVDNDFHARFDVIKKEYIYKVNVGNYNPIDRNYIYQYNKELNLEKMLEATKYLIGKHDFTSFTSKQEEKDMVRTIYKIDIKKENNILTFTFIGNGFLRYMIRNIMGVLIAVGEEKIEPNYIKKILNAKDRTKALKTANPEGLYLSNVYYYND